MPALRFQIIELLLLAIPVACVAWTVTHEEVFREPREYCERRSKNCSRWYQRKFFYLGLLGLLAGFLSWLSFVASAPV